MAISKTQNERPAIIALIDTSNTLEEGVATLGESLSNEIETRTEENQTLSSLIATETAARESADSTLETAIENEADTRADAVADLTSSISSEIAMRMAAISNVESLIGDNFTNQYSVSDFADVISSSVDDVQTFISLLKIGAATQATVQGNNYYDGTVTYPSPYTNGSTTFVFPAFLSGVDQRDLELTVQSCNEQGFTYTVINRNTTAATFTIGYLAVGISAD